VLGGTNWWSPAYSPRTGLFYVNAFDGESKFFIRDDEYVEGVRFAGGGPQGVEAVDNYVNAIRALDPTSGERRWEFRMTPQSRAGILATAGDVVFSGGIDGYFFALDAETGQELWHIALGARIQAAPITFAVDGRQYVTIAAGNVVYTFGLD
jgi:alcohol dehydrogenase (cytochrome c)